MASAMQRSYRTCGELEDKKAVLRIAARLFCFLRLLMTIC
ncbi:hypothetical protein CPter291_0549 [Collimonas pratensis]|uniref:Transposase n=1 Tax=Collimonas pratensis TaxID=279113 RepID=A0ABM5Z197_9BURK|nr:hypothetical protein CPter291_0549 [Collimonas pratensis]